MTRNQPHATREDTKNPEDKENVHAPVLKSVGSHWALAKAIYRLRCFVGDMTETYRKDRADDGESALHGGPQYGAENLLALNVEHGGI